MPLSTQTIGTQTQTFEHQVDARWLMAYAASLSDLNPYYMNTKNVYQADVVAKIKEGIEGARPPGQTA